MSDDESAARPEHKNVTEALAAVMAELPAIGKDGKADPSQGGYSYRGIEAITSHAQALLGKHGVVPYPRVVGDPVITPITVNSKPWTDTMLMVEYRFKHGPTDTEEIAGPFVAIGRDNSDKGANKCMTQAFKYALIQVLCIGDKKDDSDGESHEGDDQTQSGPPWFEQLGYRSAEHAQETNDGLKELVNEILSNRPREAREPLKAWLAERKYDTWLPVAENDADDWAYELQKVLDDFEPLRAADREGTPDSIAGGAGAPSGSAEEPPPPKPAQGATKKAAPAKKAAAAKKTAAPKEARPKETRSVHLPNGELRITEPMVQVIQIEFTKMDPNGDRDSRLRYARNVCQREDIDSTWDLSVAEASTLISNLKIVNGEEPPPHGDEEAA